MGKEPCDKPLSDDELDELCDYLASIGPTAMDIETLDGFMAALICCPEPVPQREYLRHMWGDDFPFLNADQSSAVLNLIRRRWDTIAAELHQSLDSTDQYYLPLLQRGEDGVARGNDWAKGFMRGVQLRPDKWRTLIDLDCGGPLLPIMILAYENDPDPSLRISELTPQKRHEVFAALVAALIYIYRRFEQQRRSDPTIKPDHQ